MAEDLLTGVSIAAKNAIFTRVGDLVITLWDFSLGAFVNLILLGKNAEKLEEEMSRLQDLRGDLSREAQQPMMEFTDQLSGWINRVEILQMRVETFQDSFERQSICKTGLCLGYEAVELQRKVEKLMVEGVALRQSGLVRQREPDAFELVPREMPSSSLVGTEMTMQQLRAYIMDDSVRVIGVLGMGGAGKTTLLKEINNKFLREEEARDMFNLSIWVTVSQTVDILGIQKSIGDRLGLALSSSRQGEPSDGSLRRKQAKMLSGELSKKRFILFLDDIWEKIELMEIGIPCPDESNKHKILFTSRDGGVCGEMDADQIVKVVLLDPKDSWTLFKSKMGKTSAAAVDNPDVGELAKQVVAKCGGLPVSLITVGRAMAHATTIEEWRNALHALDHCAEEVKGMKRVLASLKFSFDMLNKTLQSCLLYCVLYPEDCNISKGEVIDYWISEGFLDSKGYIDTHISHTRDRGHAWIRQLQSACLLEDGNLDETIRLHDTIRDMLVWIGGEEYVMLAGNNIARVPQREKWERAKRISAMDSETSQVPSFFGELRCEALTTLLLHDRWFGGTIQEGFFGCTRSLRVLDLSFTEIEALPSDINALVELRFLNLKSTNIASLPEELGKLTNLSYLYLNYTSQLTEIPREAVSRLTSLQVLKMHESKYSFSGHSELGLSDLENLGALCELSARVMASSSSFLHDMAVSNTFSRCIRHLEVLFYHEEDLEIRNQYSAFDVICLRELRVLFLQDDAEHPLNTDLTFGPGQLPNLEVLTLADFKVAEIVISPVSQTGSGQPLFQRLQKLSIHRCNGMWDLTWVGQLLLLERIDIISCENITELLLDDGDLPNDGRTIFTRLKHMCLYSLPSLRSISKCVLRFSSLETLGVIACPNLKRLPFGPGSAEKITQIRGEQEWWDGLEWDQPSVKSYLLNSFEARQ